LLQGGEFAFVLLALANQLNILPAELNKLLIMVVVLSMALTPLLADIGKYIADVSTGPKPPPGAWLGACRCTRK
jgi:Kef-type K+ transport system membrane component KefB